VVNLGYVSRPNGLLGAVVVHCDPSMTDVLVKGLEVELVPRQGPPLRTRIRSVAPVRGGMRVTFDDVKDRNRAEAMVGAKVNVERDRLGPFREGEYLDTDLIDIEVVTREGALLGRLVEVIATGANDVYAVRTPDGGEVLIPAVGHAVLDVDLPARRMTVAGEALEYSPPSPPKPEPGSRAKRGEKTGEHAADTRSDTPSDTPEPE